MKCKEHPRYYARNKPKDGCSNCWKMWKWSMFASWAIRENIMPDELYSAEKQFTVQNHLVFCGLAASIERDMYSKETI